jgi:predicted  nucleic acid-binding Zn-ribbon protein
MSEDHLKDDIEQIRAEQHRLADDQRKMKDDIVELKTNYVHTSVALTKITEKLDNNSRLVLTTLVSVVVSVGLYLLKGSV